MKILALYPGHVREGEAPSCGLGTKLTRYKIGAHLLTSTTHTHEIVRHRD